MFKASSLHTQKTHIIIKPIHYSLCSKVRLAMLTQKKYIYLIKIQFLS